MSDNLDELCVTSESDSMYSHIIDEYRRGRAEVNDYSLDDNRDIDAINAGKLSEDLLHVKYSKMNSLTAQEKEAIKADGLVVTVGRFSREEDRILTKNWMTFCDDFVVNKPHLVLGFFQFSKDTESDEKFVAKRLARKSHLYLRLSKGLPQRTLYQCYQRARKLFSGLNKSANLTPEDKEEILRLNSMGMKGSDIGNIVFCDIKTVSQVIRTNVNINGVKLKKSYWTQEEDDELIKHVKRWLKKHKSDDYSAINWFKIALKMKDRNARQCRIHFRTKVIVKFLNPDSGLKRWTRRQDRKLIEFLYTNKYENEGQIDWDFIKEEFSRYCVYNGLIQRWYALKSRLDDHQFMSYQQLVNTLYETYVA